MKELRTEEVHRLVFGDMKAAFSEQGHPGFHLSAPSHTLLDFWGLVKKDGVYHILYHTCPLRGHFQHNTYFFHSTSKNLMDWEMLPIPIAPLEDELRMNDGCICFDNTGTPVMLYTKVWHDETIPRVHCAAHGTPDLRSYTRRTAEPFMTMENHGGPRFQNGWSDPFVFTAGGRTFMLMSKCVTMDGENRMPIYEATDGTMLHWEYKGIFFDSNGEVVSFFSLGGKWVLSYSPYDAPEYFVGTFDLKNLRFIPEAHGTVSYGYHGQKDGKDDRGFYAQCMLQENNRTLFTGWISGFQDTEYWDGCMSIPREVGLDSKLRLTQNPVREFLSLRGSCVFQADEVCSDVAFHAQSDMLDLECTFCHGGEFAICLETESDTVLELHVSGNDFSVNGEAYPDTLSGGEDKVRIIIDRSFCEIFFGEGTVCATRCFPYIGGNPKIRIRCGQNAKVTALTCYTVNSCTVTVDPEVRKYLT